MSKKYLVLKLGKILSKSYKKCDPFLLDYLTFGLSYGEVRQILSLKEKNMSTYLQNHINGSYMTLTPPLSLLDVLKVFSHTSEMKKRIYKHIMNYMSYSILLITFSFMMSVLYVALIVPRVKENMSFDGVNFWSMDFCSGILCFTMLIVVINILFIGILRLFIKNRSFSIILYILSGRLRLVGIVKCYISLNFCFLIHTFMEAGVPTIHALKSISKCRAFKIESWIAYHILDGLHEGKSFDTSIRSPYLSHSSILLFSRGLVLEDFAEHVRLTMEILKSEMERLIIHASYGLRLFTYGYIFLIIVSFMQIIMVPVTLMEVL